MTTSPPPADDRTLAVQLALRGCVADQSAAFSRVAQAARELSEAVAEFGRVFRAYEEGHRAKDEPGRQEKADRNAAYAERAEELVARWQL